MGRVFAKHAAVSFCGVKYTNKTSLYAAVCIVRDGLDTTFEASTEDLCSPAGYRVYPMA